MGAIWLGSWSAQSLTGWRAYNETQLEHGDSTLSWLQYLGSADFWQTTLQNWQSEFLAVGSMAVFAIYLRQRGSPESKPVGAPHEATGVEANTRWSAPAGRPAPSRGGAAGRPPWPASSR